MPLALPVTLRPHTSTGPLLLSFSSVSPPQGSLPRRPYPAHTLHALALPPSPLRGHIPLASFKSVPWCFVRSSPQSVKCAGMGGGKLCPIPCFSGPLFPLRPRSALRAETRGRDTRFHNRLVAKRLLHRASSTGDWTALPAAS